MNDPTNTDDEPLERLDDVLRRQQARRASASSALEQRYAELGEFIYRVAYPAFHKLKMSFRSYGKTARIIPPEDRDDPRTLGLLIFSDDGPEFMYAVWAKVVTGRAFIMKRYVAYDRGDFPPVDPTPTKLVNYPLVGDKIEGRTEDQCATNVTEEEVIQSVTDEYENFSQEWENEKELERGRNEGEF